MLCADAYFSLTDDCTVTAKHWGRIGSKRVKIDLRSASGLNNWAATMSLSQAQALAADIQKLIDAEFGPGGATNVVQLNPQSVA